MPGRSPHLGQDEHVLNSSRRTGPGATLWLFVLMLGALTFLTALVVATDSLSRVPHPPFLHDVIHEGGHHDLHWSE